MSPEGASRLPFHLSLPLCYRRVFVSCFVWNLRSCTSFLLLFQVKGSCCLCLCSRCLFVSLPLLSLYGRAARRRRDNEHFRPGYLHLQASFLSVSEQQTEEIHIVATSLMMVLFFWNSLPVKGITTDTRKRQALRISL